MFSYYLQIPGKHYRDRDGRGRLVDLVLLDLQDNRLTYLPDDFLSNMLSLRKLVVSKNRYRYTEPPPRYRCLRDKSVVLYTLYASGLDGNEEHQKLL